MIFSHAGVRPKGRGLFSFLYHYLIDGVGVFGYDPIQGALSPPLRLLCHVSAIFVLWGFMILYPIPILDFSDHHNHPQFLPCPTRMLAIPALNLPTIVWFRGMSALFVYMLSFYDLFYVFDGVSVPSGPRPHKIQRFPRWENKTWELTAIASKNWRCVTAQEAHAVTEARFAGTTNAALSGEPSGRDVWTVAAATTATAAAPSNKQINVDETVVQEMASGGTGTPAGFNPHVNPNRYRARAFFALFFR